MKKFFPYSLTAALILAIALSGCGGGGGTTRYTLNITVEGQGTVTPVSGTTYPVGTLVELTATGATGYALDHWGGTDASVVVENKIKMDGNKNIVAVFTKLKYDLTVIVSPEGAGTVDTVITLLTKSVYGVEHGQQVRLNAKANPGYVFDHWDGDMFGNMNPATLTMDGAKTVSAIFVPWQTMDILMRSIPGPASFPVTIDDFTSNPGPGTVSYAYEMAETEVTYEQWYAIKLWAVNHGYTFTNNNNAGREGSMGTDGAAPTVNKRHPVTMITWRDAVVWCNALTEYYNKQYGTDLDYAYKNGSEIIKDATNSAAFNSINDGTNVNGFRLPTSMEWELAARYRGNDSTNAMEYPTGSGTYWTHGNSASGAELTVEEDYDNTACNAVAWHHNNSGQLSHIVAYRLPNFLGLFDMSGNVNELCFDLWSDFSSRMIRGGNYEDDISSLQVGFFVLIDPVSAYDYTGFRPVRTQ